MARVPRLVPRLAPRIAPLAVALFAFALLAASCSGDSSTDADAGGDSSADSGDSGDGATDLGADPDTDPDPGADADADPGADADAGPGAEADADDEPEPEPEPEEPAGPDVRTLALMPDPVGSTDPLETVNHLPSVQIFTADDGIAFVFDSLPEVGNRVLIAPAGVEIFCDMWEDADGLRVECGGYNLNDNTFLEQMPVPQVDMALGYGLVVPMTVDGDMVTITLGGTAYSASEVRVGQEPAFVQIDVNTGGLAAEVVRTVGIATAADIEAALA